MSGGIEYGIHLDFNIGCSVVLRVFYCGFSPLMSVCRVSSLVFCSCWGFTVWAVVVGLFPHGRELHLVCAFALLDVVYFGLLS